MTEWQGAILLVQLQRLPEHMSIRDRNAGYLIGELSKIPGIRPLEVDARVTRHAWHVFMIRYNSEAFGGLHRNDFLKALTAEGIPCGPGYTPLTHSEAILDGLRSIGVQEPPRPCPVSERASNEEAVYFTHNMLLGTREDMDSIVEAVGKIQRAAGD